MNEIEQQYRNQLTKYAADDCLSIQRILISLNIIQLNYHISSTRTSTTPTTTTATTNKYHTNIELEYTFDENDLFIMQQSIHESNAFIFNDKSLSEDNQRSTQQSIELTPTIAISNKETNNDRINKLELTSNTFSDNNNETIDVLSREKRKRIHDRSCALKQRKKLYQHEIVMHNTDRWFIITNIKTILRQYSVDFLCY
ncbi:unnamed protein product [Rotaria sp. Silwood1]|nr:unnamed protein product [Rotaria sp. Silwood1]CAF1379696.1 unnamed protein product [Rotaria sp. Silwood1]CAF3474705.1 unnamed protein product [Rotaria sp. Silwood1]CAF3593564.1 unnamed protein product [Rotaria sp. Silwood1]CAF4945212.1 unnamed protein product [Rotaria sp. Silwood1]